MTDPDLPVYAVLALLVLKEAAAVAFKIVDKMTTTRSTEERRAIPSSAREAMGKIHDMHSGMGQLGRSLDKQTQVLEAIRDELVRRGPIIDQIHNATVNRAGNTH